MDSVDTVDSQRCLHVLENKLQNTIPPLQGARIAETREMRQINDGMVVVVAISDQDKIFSVRTETLLVFF